MIKSYLLDIYEHQNCNIFGDRGYIRACVQLDLFETAKIKLECPYKLNQKEWEPIFTPFDKAKKRIGTVFSQMCDQFMIERNYAKQTTVFSRIIGKISAFIILQHRNYINNKPIDRIKYELK